METEEDYFEVENMVRNSFWNIYRPGAFEHYIVHNLRDDESFLENLTYVMESNDEIIGYIGYSEGFIDYGDERIGAVVLGPLAIHEDFQNQGLGSKLIGHTLNLAKDEDIPFVFVVGDEDYYRRFGFISASEYDLYLEGTDMGEECPFFMIRLFVESELKDGIGIFHNPDVFDVNPEDVDEFDKKFEYKKKEVLEGQLEGL